MRIAGISRAAGILPVNKSPVVKRIEAVRSIIVKARSQKKDNVSVLLNNNNTDLEVIKRLSRQFDVSTQNNGKSIKVNIGWK